MSCLLTVSIAPDFLSGLLPTPNCLQESIPLRKSVQAVITLGSAAHKAAQRIDLVLAGVAACLVDLADADLNRSMVFSFDDAICGRAFAWDVTVKTSKVQYDAVSMFCDEYGARSTKKTPERVEK